MAQPLVRFPFCRDLWVVCYLSGAAGHLKKPLNKGPLGGSKLAALSHAKSPIIACIEAGASVMLISHVSGLDSPVSGPT